ncbi:TPA: NAD(P)H-binding protein [Streptococcus suis]|nr:NAD(P)H-binding protein [Streptococcus suis]
MKVFIAGGTGRVADFLIQNLTNAGHQVVAGARSPEKVVTRPGVMAVPLDLHADVASLAERTQSHLYSTLKGLSPFKGSLNEIRSFLAHITLVRLVSLASTNTSSQT